MTQSGHPALISQARHEVSCTSATTIIKIPLAAICQSRDNPGAYTRFVIVDHVGKLIVVSISQPGDLPRAVVAATCLVSLSNTSNSAEFGASPYPKGFRDNSEPRA